MNPVDQEAKALVCHSYALFENKGAVDTSLCMTLDYIFLYVLLTR